MADHLGVVCKLFSLIGRLKAEVKAEMASAFSELTADELSSLMRQAQASWLVVSSKLSLIALLVNGLNWRVQLTPVFEVLTDLSV